MTVEPELKVIAKELLDQYKVYEQTKSKIRRCEEGKKLDKAFKKLKKFMEKQDESIFFT